VDVRGQRNQLKIEEPSLYKPPDPIGRHPQPSPLPEQTPRARDLHPCATRCALPGISRLRRGRRRQGDNLRLRGFPASNDIYIDGARDPASTGATRSTWSRSGKGPPRSFRPRLTGGSSTSSKTPVTLARADRHVGTGPGRVAVDANQPIGGSGALRLNLMGSARRWAEYGPAAPGARRPSASPRTLYLVVSYYYLDDDNIPDYGFPYPRQATRWTGR
jgi:catecholate siderophore receptor